MNFTDNIASFQFWFNAMSLVACVFLCAEYIFIVRVRKPPYPWSSYAVSLMLFSIACQRLQQITERQEVSTPWQFTSQCILNGALVLATLMIPMVRKGTYKRPRFDQLQEINNSLKYSQSLFRSYLDEAPLVAYIKDKYQKVIQVNAGFSRLLGESPESVLGKTNLWGDANLSSLRDAQILKGEGEKAVIETLALKDRSCTILDIRFPLVGPNGELMMGGIAVDVTDQLKRKNKTEVFASIIELSPDAIYSIDESGKVLSWNTAAEELFGYTKDEIIGHSIVKISPAENRAELALMIKSFSDNPTTAQHFEAVRISKDRLIKSVQIAAACVPDPEMCIAVITRDITQKRQMSRQIELLNEELNEKVKELSIANINLQKARDEALESASMKSAFVANISHELRTPLSGILGLSELLTTKSLDGDSQRLMNMLHESAQSLLQTIEDILDLAKLEAGKASVELSTFSILKLVLNCIQIYSAPAFAKTITLHHNIDREVPEWIYSDASIIKQILCNLLANSIRFTRSGTITVSLSTSVDISQNQMLKFSVSDTGMGIESDRLSLLFSPFARVSDSTDGIRGTGLGLALSRRLVDLMQGQIGCNSELGKGSTFWFTIPLNSSQMPADSAQNSPNAELIPQLDLAKCRVLSVDDSPVVSRLTMRQLEIIGVRAEAAVTGIEAIERSETNSFDVILMDVYLPDMTGYEAAHKIRALWQDRAEPTPLIIALTGCSVDTLREEAESAVMDDFLEKPVSIERLKSALIQAVVSRQLQHDHE